MDVAITTNAGSIVANLAARAAALRNLRPVLKDIAAEVDRVTAEAFEKSKRVDGLPFQDLRDSTIVDRLRRRKGLFKKAAKLSKADKAAIRAELADRRNRSIYVRRARALTTGPAASDARARRREQVLAAAKAMKFKPLIDTGRMRNSAKARVVGDTTVRWAIVDYGTPHITGAKNGRPPQRNPSVFRVIGGTWVIDPKVAAFITARIVAHVTKPEAAK